MSIRLNSSMPAFAMRQMNLAQDKASVSMQRLASGLRINSATDDAAGLAIATGMTSKIQGYNQSIRNANDDISVLQIAEGALSEVTNVLQRMRELTVQAGNDTNSQLNRASISQEIDMLSSSVKEMMQNTEFNGMPLFANHKSTFNVGLEGPDFALNIGGFNFQSLALNGASSANNINSGRVSNGSSNDQAININGINLPAIGGTTEDKIKQLNQQLNRIAINAQGNNQIVASASTGITDGRLTINGAQVAASRNIIELSDNINRDVGGVTATIDGNGQLLLSNDSGQDITVDNQGNEAGSGLINDTYRGVISLHSLEGEKININLNNEGTQADLDALGLTVQQGNDNLQSQLLSGSSISSTDKIAINGYSLNINSQISSAYDIAAAFNEVSKQTGVTVTAKTEVLLSPDFTQRPLAEDDIRINGQQIDLTASSSVDDVITQINKQLDSDDILATADNNGRLSLVSKLGYDITIEQDSNDFLQTGLTTTSFHGKLNFQSASNTIHIDSALAGQDNKESALAKIGLSDTSGFTDIAAGINVFSAEGVSESLKALDQALLAVTNERSSYGAQQNRLGQTINQLSGMVINTESSRSRVMDTDYAAESASLVKNQLLMQTSSAMLVRFTQMHSKQILSLINSLN